VWHLPVAKMPGPGLRPFIGIPAGLAGRRPGRTAASWEHSGGILARRKIKASRSAPRGPIPASIVEQYEAATTRC